MKTKLAMLGIIIAIFVLGTTLSATLPVTSQSTPEIFVVNPMNPANPAAKDGNFKFSTDTTSVGFKFNATFWATGFVDPAVYAWQVTVYYNATILNATRAWLPPPTDSDYILFGHSSTRPRPFFSSNYVKIGDTSQDTSVTSATPKKLGTVEFQIILAPSTGKVSCNLGINNTDTYLLDDFLSEITVTKTNGYYELAAPVVPDFSISASPSSLTIALEGSADSTVTITSMNGFNQLVGLSVSGVPTGVTAVLNPSSVTAPANGEATSILTIDVGTSTVPDTYTLTITGTSGTLSHTTSIELTVASAPDFSISASPDSLTIVQGASDTSTITIGSLQLFSSAVTLSVSGAPTGVTTSFSTNPVTPPAGSFATSILTVEVGVSTVAGTYSLTVTGTSGALTMETLTHSTTIALTVTPPPDFTIAASPMSLTIAPGKSDTTTVTVTSLNGFTSEVAISISGLPAETTGTFNPVSITPPPDGSATSTLTIDVGASTVLGTYSLEVIGTSGPLSHNITISLAVTAAPDFLISASPNSLTIVQGASDNSTITVTSLNGFNSAVDLTVSGLPAGTTAAFSPTSVTPPSHAPGSATSTLTINVGSSTANGTYSVTVIGTSGTLAHSVTITLTVTAAPIPITPDFSVSASPSSLTIVQGGVGSSTINVTSINGFNSDVSLIISGALTGVNLTLDPTSLTPSPDGFATSTLTVTVNATATAGSYTLTITGTSGSLTHNAAISLVVKQSGVIKACVKFKPEALNLKSKGKWITCFIRLPRGYNASEIDPSTIVLNGTIPASEVRVIWDCDHDRVIGLMVKFNRTQAEQFILNSIQVTGKCTTVKLTVTGSLKDGTQFQGTDRIRVIMPHPHHYHHHHHYERNHENHRNNHCHDPC